MKKMIMLCLSIVLLLCSCTAQIDDSSVQDSNSINDEDYNSAPDKNIAPIPLLFIDTTDNLSDKAYIICAFDEDKLYTVYDFAYNGKDLQDYISAQGTTVETDIIDKNKAVTFYDKNGNSFDSFCGIISCYGEQIIGEVHVCTDIQAEIPKDSKRFLGTYSGVDIFPEQLKYGDNSIEVDLDSDGVNEVIRWSFSVAEGDWDGDNYYYTLEVVKDGKTVSVSDNYEWFPIEKEDFEIFIADVDMDGVFEIIEYVKALSSFSDVFIYDVNAEKCERLHFYTITPEP